jgi:hypothetical protein
MKKIGLGMLAVVIGALIWLQSDGKNVNRKANRDPEITEGYRYQPSPRKIPQFPPAPKPIPPAKPSTPQPKPLPDAPSETGGAKNMTGA